MLLTAGKDRMVKLWDTRTLEHVHTFIQHRGTIHGVRFQAGSSQFCSVGCDKTMNLWEAGERCYMDSLYGHNDEINAIDSIDGSNFVTCGSDQQVILWKMEQESQLVYQGHQYSLDCVGAISSKSFVTGSQDGKLCLWAAGKKKPVFTLNRAHGFRPGFHTGN